ncbi:hypothetical protein CSOJ01_15661 [Colletotrichum sojae]|uniref:Uncharacterized protein n=1 Tax=Colletotrichum sojae TaxID=2175907 RepID=A0A8H6MH83_9PEZI|nr:hypothetical protein CSOJ01_15661 [Colletotrichum sojae]
MIDEHNLFVSLENFDSDAAIDTEFNTLIGLATTVCDETLATDAVQISGNAAVVGCIWSFGVGMMVFAAIATSAIIKKDVVSSKSTDGPEPQADNRRHRYRSSYRSQGLECMAQIAIAGGKLDVATFREYANSARLIFNSKEIIAVYDALDHLNMSRKSDADLKNCMDSLKAFKLGGTTALYSVLSVCILIMSLKMKVATDRLSQLNKTDEFVAEGKETIIDKVDVVEQSKKMVRDLNGAMKTGYKDFFNGIKDAANSYNTAITNKTS